MSKSEMTTDNPTTTEPETTTETAPVTETADERRDSRTRAKLREVEAERDALRAALLPHVRAAAEKLAGERLASGPSLWLAGVDPLSLLDDEHNVDPAKVTTAVDRLLDAAPQFGQKAPSFDSGARSDVAPTRGWADLIDKA